MYKLVFDLMKHLTTLSSGSILILITLLEKVFRESPPTLYIRFSFGGFCISIIAAVVAMMVLSMNAADGAITEGERTTFAAAASISAVSFSLGIIFVVFAALPSLG
nr:hypothetical protein [Janthinobacterium sp. Marseille]